MIYNTIIIDDEPLAREGLNILLSKISSIKLIGEASNGFEGIKIIDSLKPDLIFLDIQMPGINGFEMLQHLVTVPLVIFTTAYDQYALDAFKTLAIDYLLKPISSHQLLTAISKIDQLKNNIITLNPLLKPAKSKPSAFKYLQRFVLKHGNKYTIINADEVISFFAEDRYCYLRTDNGINHIIDFSLIDLHYKLDPQQFIRIHRSFIVSLEKIKSFISIGSGRLQVIMTDNSKALCSRAYSGKLRKLFNKEEKK